MFDAWQISHPVGSDWGPPNEFVADSKCDSRKNLQVLYKSTCQFKAILNPCIVKCNNTPARN